MNPFPAAFSARFPHGNGQANLSRYFLQLTDIDTPSRAIILGDSVDWHMALMSNDWWTADNRWGYYSAHPDRHGRVANYLMADGSVTPLTKDDALARLRNPNQ